MIGNDTTIGPRKQNQQFGLAKVLADYGYQNKFDLV